MMKNKVILEISLVLVKKPCIFPNMVGMHLRLLDRPLCLMFLFLIFFSLEVLMVFSSQLISAMFILLSVFSTY